MHVVEPPISLPLPPYSPITNTIENDNGNKNVILINLYRTGSMNETG